MVIDLDATLVTAHSEKQDATRTWKKGFGFHPLLGFVDHGGAQWWGAGGRAAAAGEGRLEHRRRSRRRARRRAGPAPRRASRPGRGRAGWRCWCAPMPPEPRRSSPRTCTSTGWSSPSAPASPTSTCTPPSRSCRRRAWTPAYQARKPRAAEHGVQIEPRDGAWVAEATGLIPLTGWPPGTRLILRKERPHPGAQLRITDADGLRITGFLTNTARGGPAASSPTWNYVTAATPGSRTGSARRRTPGCATCPSTTPTRTGSGSPSPHSPRTCSPGARGSPCPPPPPATNPSGYGCGSSPPPDGSCAPRGAASCTSTRPGPGPRPITTAHTRLSALPVP